MQNIFIPIIVKIRIWHGPLTNLSDYDNQVWSDLIVLTRAELSEIRETAVEEETDLRCKQIWQRPFKM